MMTRRTLLFVVAAAFVLGSFQLGAQELVISDPVMYPESAQTTAYFGSLVEAAAQALTSGEAPVYRRVSYRNKSWGTGRGGDTLTLTTSLYDSPEQSVTSLSVVSSRGGSDSMAMLKSVTKIPAREFVQILTYFKASVSGFAGTGGGPAPLLLETLEVKQLKFRDLGINPYMGAGAVSVRPDGNFLVAAHAFALEFDSEFRLVQRIGSEQLENGLYSSAYKGGFSNAGTAYLVSSEGDSILQYIPGVERPRRLRSGIQQAIGFAILRDGSLFVTQAVSNRAVRVTNGQAVSVTMEVSPDSTLFAVTGDPAGNLWAMDPTSGHLLIMSPDGRVLDTIIPGVPDVDRRSIRALAVYADGSFVAVTMSSLMRFRRNGELVWRINEIPSNPPSKFEHVMSIDVDSDNGYIYLAGFANGIVNRLVDVSYQRENNISNARDQELLRLLQAVDRQGTADTYAALATFYESRESLALAAQTWNKGLDADPFFFEAEEALRILDRRNLEVQADQIAANMDQSLQIFGIETARPLYQRALALYEQALALAPGDPTITNKVERLRTRFETAAGGNTRQNRAIRIDTARVENLFPSLMFSYNSQPVGSVRITNTLDTPIDNVRAELKFAQYMDAPATSPGPQRLAPGQSVEFPLFVSLNNLGLELDEDLPLLASVTVSYETGGATNTSSRNVGTTLLKRSALSWDDSRKLMVFITPNESEVSGFARRILSSSDQNLAAILPQRLANFLARYRSFRQAVIIINALGAYQIQYTEDPASPITRILGQAATVDTVRFPRETLYFQSGDCDDTTALLASMLEAVGIQTAVMTSPGHVFLAFNTRIPAENLWMFQSQTTDAIVHNGEIWLPIESTNTQEGFMKTWEFASSQYRTHAASGNVEFLPVAESRQLFPALPLPRSSYSLATPASSAVATLLGAQGDQIAGKLYDANLGALNQELAASGGAASAANSAAATTPAARARLRTALVAMNKVGILHDLFGERAAAEAAYARALEADGTFLPTLVNYASFLIQISQARRALELADKIEGIRPGSAVTLALKAQAHFALGQRQEAERFYTRLSTVDSGLSSSLAYMGFGGASASRASEAVESGYSLFLLED